MSLAPGTRLGPYEIAAQIGVGGMGEVYQATDTKLKRQVAIKVLPEAVAADAERLARFQREAEVLASLNHPNIAAIYGLEDTPDAKALVMELVEGPTLADRVAQGPIPVDEALPIAKQIAEALEAAHEQGIIHRDLKPANIKVRDDGTVKVLDFGLAKAVEPVGAASGSASVSMSPTITTPAMTEMGMILGTAAYMSPEQARGRPVGKRADIWAFGAVLYEILTGRRAFEGEDVSATLADVIRGEPAWDRLPDGLPASLVVFLRRCLEKDPAARVRDIGDVRLALDGAFEPPRPSGAATLGDSLAQRRRVWPLAAALVVALATAIALLALRTSAPDLRESRWRTFPVGPDPAQLSAFAVSPDGRSVVITAADQQLWLWPLDSLEARPLAGTEGASRHPFWSPDSQSVAFAADGTLYRIDVAGGPPQTLARGATLPGPYGAWSASETILFNDTDGGFSRVPARGGEVVPVVRPSASGGHLDLPTFLPDGTHFLYLDHTAGSGAMRGIYVGSIDAGPDEQPTEPVLAADDGPVLVHAAGWDVPRVLFLRQGELLAQAFDPEEFVLMGDPIAVATGVQGGAGNGWVSASATGDVLLYRPGTATGGLGLRGPVWVDRQGVEEAIDVTPGPYITAQLSPDGRRVALSTGSTDADVYTWDFERELRFNVTASGAPDRNAIWTPDGSRLVFWSDRDDASGLYWQAADGSGPPERLTERGSDQASGVQIPNTVSPDGWLVYQEFTGAGPDLRMVSLNGDHATQDLLSTEFAEGSADVSPDGRWIVYQSNRSGNFEIYASPFPSAASRLIPISSGGGESPAWASDGRSIFYISPAGEMMSVPVDVDGGDLVPGRATRLFDARGYLLGGAPFESFDVAGDRFLFVKVRDSQPGSETGQIDVVLNGLDGLAR